MNKTRGMLIWGWPIYNTFMFMCRFLILGGTLNIDGAKIVAVLMLLLIY